MRYVNLDKVSLSLFQLAYSIVYTYCHRLRYISVEILPYDYRFGTYSTDAYAAYKLSMAMQLSASNANEDLVYG